MVVLIIATWCVPLAAKKKPHPFDKYDHDMHMGLFEAASVLCDQCHADPESYGNRAKINPMGCHLCHNNPKAPLPATHECTLCHEGGPPKPQNHKTDWLAKHQVYAKQNPAECRQCHTDRIFCIECHSRRDTVTQRVHRRNFKFFHSIEARANPHRCDACHTVDVCRRCHEGKGDAGR